MLTKGRASNDVTIFLSGCTFGGHFRRQFLGRAIIPKGGEAHSDWESNYSEFCGHAHRGVGPRVLLFCGIFWCSFGKAHASTKRS